MSRGRTWKGGALYMALIICIVIGVILSVLILIAHFNQRQVLAFAGDQQLRWELESAFPIAQSAYFTDEENGRWQATDSGDSLRLRRCWWGAYRLIAASARNAHRQLDRCGLYGVFLPADTALYIEDAGRPASFAGTVGFRGKAYLPAGGFRTAYIEGAGAVIDPGIQAYVAQSRGALPQVSEQLLEGLRQLLQSPALPGDSLGSLEAAQISQPFTSPTLLFRSGNVDLASCRLSRNIKVAAEHSLVIDSSAHLDNVFLIATKVHFKKGFHGCVQVLAADSIVLEEGCHFDYPSSLTVLSDGEGGNGLKGIFVAPGCRVEGSLLALRDGRGPGKVTVSSGAGQFFGLVYSSDYAGLQGELYGSLLCTKLLLQTPSAVYENHLFNCRIDASRYAGSLFVPGIFGPAPARQCVKRL